MDLLVDIPLLGAELPPGLLSENSPGARQFNPEQVRAIARHKYKTSAEHQIFGELLSLQAGKAVHTLSRKTEEWEAMLVVLMPRELGRRVRPRTGGRFAGWRTPDGRRHVVQDLGRVPF